MTADSILYRDLAYVFVVALLGGLVARRLGQPLIVGYVLGGIVIGPFTPGPTLSEMRVLELLAVDLDRLALRRAERRFALLERANVLRLLALPVEVVLLGDVRRNLHVIGERLRLRRGIRVPLAREDLLPRALPEHAPITEATRGVGERAGRPALEIERATQIPDKAVRQATMPIAALKSIASATTPTRRPPARCRIVVTASTDITQVCTRVMPGEPYWSRTGAFGSIRCRRRVDCCSVPLTPPG